MAELPLSVSERKRLVQMIARRGSVDTYDRQRNFVENCGLDSISERLRYGDTPGNFAQMLIRESQHVGIIGNPPDHALRHVLQYVREELVSGHPDESLFIDTLLSRTIPENHASFPLPYPKTPASLKFTAPGAKTTPSTLLNTNTPAVTRLPTSGGSTTHTPASDSQVTTSEDDLPFFLLDGWWYGTAFLLFVLGGAAGWVTDALIGWGISLLDYPRYLSQELIVGTGGLCGLVYAVAGAFGYPITRGDYFNSAVDGYLLLLDGFGITERVAGLLTSLPFNLMISVVLTYGVKFSLVSLPGIAELTEATTQSLFMGFVAAGWVLRWATEA